MTATYKGFRRNPDGSWTCVAESTIEGPNGRMPVTPGMTFARGLKFMGVDLAALLDTLAGTKSEDGRAEGLGPARRRKTAPRPKTLSAPR